MIEFVHSNYFVHHYQIGINKIYRNKKKQTRILWLIFESLNENTQINE